MAALQRAARRPMPRPCRAGGSLQRYMQINANPHMHDGGGLPEPLAVTPILTLTLTLTITLTPP